MTINFNSTKQLINFILNTETFNNWDVAKLELESQYMKITLNPIYVDFNNNHYVKFGNKSFNNYCHLELITTNNNYQIVYQFTTEIDFNVYNFKDKTNTEIDMSDSTDMFPRNIVEFFINNIKDDEIPNIDLKLAYPQQFKSIFDPNNNYDKFYIDFFNKKDCQGCIFSYSENIKNPSTDPPKNWIDYCISLVPSELR